LLAPSNPVIRPVPRTGAEHGWHLYAILVEFAQLGTTRSAFMKGLGDRGIGSQVHYIPVHRQPYYRHLYGDLDLPGADSYYARCLSIPMFPAMTDADVHAVADGISALAVDKAP